MAVPTYRELAQAQAVSRAYNMPMQVALQRTQGVGVGSASAGSSSGSSKSSKTTKKSKSLSSSKTPYMDSYNRLANSYRAQAQTDIANLNSRRDADLATSNAGYDQTAKQNYLNYMQAQKNLAGQLNSLGINGGASESSAIRLNTNYGTNVANNETARQAAADSIRSSYAQQIADYNKSLNEKLATARATAEQNQITYNTERLDKDLQRFSESIEGRWKTKDKYEKYIKKLRKSNDPNKKYKIALAQKAMNQLEDENVSGGGGGGGYSRSYGGGGYSSSYSSGNDSNNSGGSKKKKNSSLKSKYGNNVGTAMANAIKKNSKSKTYTWTASKKTTSGRNRRSISRGNGLLY